MSWGVRRNGAGLPESRVAAGDHNQVAFVDRFLAVPLNDGVHDAGTNRREGHIFGDFAAVALDQNVAQAKESGAEAGCRLGHQPK